MKRLLILSSVCVLSACGWNKEGPMFPDAEPEQPAVYEDNDARVLRVQEQDRRVQYERPIDRPSRLFDEKAPVAAVQGELSYAEDVQAQQGGSQTAFREVGFYDKTEFEHEPEAVQHVEVVKEGNLSVEHVENVVVDQRPHLAVDTSTPQNLTPEVYSVLATRMTNQIIDSTASIYEVKKTPTIYVMEPKKSSKDLPYGLAYAKRTTSEILDGSKTFNVANNMQDSDYHLETLVDLIELDGVPAIKYRAILFDKEEKKIKEWVETIKQISNDDRTWW